MKKGFVAIVVLVFVAVLGWKIYAKVTAEEETQGGPRGGGTVPVELAAVTKAEVRDVAAFTGSLEPRAAFEIAPKVGGRLDKLMVAIGDTIENGALIAKIEDDEYARQVEQAAAELDVAKANLEDSKSSLANAQREYERTQALREKKIASESELDAAQAALDAGAAKLKVATAQIAQKEAALRMAEVRLGYTSICAAWEGGGKRVVGEKYVDEGAMLSSNAPIVSVLQIDTLLAVMHVIERDYSRVGIGQEVALSTDAFPGRTFPGRILRIAPLLREESRQARVEVEVDNPEMLLKPGMFVRAEVEFTRRASATVVPEAALEKRDGRVGVFLADPDRKVAVFTPVTLGISDPPVVEVLEPAGLSGSVVTLGKHLLQDGGKISVPETPSVPKAAGSPGGAA